MAKRKNNSYVMIIADLQGRKQSALARGFSLAQALDCEARVVAFCHESLVTLEASNVALAQKARKSIIRLRREALRKEVQKHAVPGLKIRTEIAWSKHVHQWVEAECRSRPPLVVVKTGHRTETFRYTPTDWHLIREGSAPILIVAEKKWRKTRPVLAAVDLATRSRPKQQLNRRVIETAKRYADALNCPLYLLHVIHYSPLLTELDLIDEYSHTKQIKAGLEPKVKKMAHRHEIPVDRFLLKRGPVDKVIISESARLKAQLLVLGTVGRKGARAKLIGNTAEKVLMLARTDLLTLKP